ncbi:IPExxxVDY family protein [Aquimarina agarilytica]|uniref:IPExxxVDY family protein n=1 Tax=Aquimarina agarilytica TaxID=1087449 RepID=UPI0002892B78|nr:IPExxxVDY family protein [Aquimarina agarilytica]
MAINKLVLDSFEVDAFYLCAIHASLPSYKMAFLLNRQLELKFSRVKNDVEVLTPKNIEIYPRYVFEDDQNYTTFTLVKNKCLIYEEISIENTDLFAESITQQTTKNLIPELKSVDYFLKIETHNFNYSLKLLISKILKITQVITAFAVDYETIKSKNNLIFE